MANIGGHSNGTIPLATGNNSTLKQEAGGGTVKHRSMKLPHTVVNGELRHLLH